MRTIIINLANIESVRALHIYLQYALNLPDHYGRNLDALHDVLTEMDEDVTILVRAQGAKGETAAYLPRLLRVMQDAAGENTALSVRLLRIDSE